MGLTARSTGSGVLSSDIRVEKSSPDDKVIVIAGNPNVGKSTVFNGLTGLRQHTGNWPGKTVSIAQGGCRGKELSYVLVDVPGTYSLLAHSAEEEVARNFICFGDSVSGAPDAAVVVCDATCLERSLNLALQVMEICPRTLVCVNLLDEAKRRDIRVDLEKLGELLGVPVVGTSAHQKPSLKKITDKLDELCGGKITPKPRRLRYIEPIEQAVSMVEPALEKRLGGAVPPRWLALRLIDNDSSLAAEIKRCLGIDPASLPEIAEALERARAHLAENGITSDALKDRIVSCILLNAEEICGECVLRESRGSSFSRADSVLTSRLFGYPIMLLMLTLVFWITIVGANYPSELLGNALFWLGDRLGGLLTALGAPEWVNGLLVDGAYRVLAWVVAVMLPPMAIFFPLFTLLEDLGYLPRVAYNLDKPFCKCKACGKQALTMCMVCTILSNVIASGKTPEAMLFQTFSAFFLYFL